VKSTAPWQAAAVSRSRAKRGCAAAILMSSVCFLLAACSGGDPTLRDAANYEPTPQEPAPVEAGGDGPATVDGAQCTAVIAQHPNEGAIHVPCTSSPTYQTQPPSSGNHFGCWPEYRTFDVPVPWGNLMHGLEHGAIAIVYNCGAAGCPDEVARAQTFIDSLPPDTAGGCPSTRRVILAPDPTLPVRWAATAWTWTLRADCFDETAFNQFYVDHYDRAPESICNPGAPYANLCDGVRCG
jgi:Protein of unknown function (DUF3105)